MRKIIIFSFILAFSVLTGCSQDNAESNVSTVFSNTVSSTSSNVTSFSVLSKVENSSAQVSSAPQSKPLPTTEEEAVQYLVENIKSGNYEDAIYNTWDFRNSNKTRDLHNYAFALMYHTRTDFKSRNIYIECISPDYKGELSGEMKKFCLKYADIQTHDYADLFTGDKSSNKIYVLNYDKIDALNEVDTRKPPAIGMTPEEVRNSRWGSPYEINRTTTAFSVSEQWVYKNGYSYKFIYFQDGVVVAISE